MALPESACSPDSQLSTILQIEFCDRGISRFIFIMLNHLFKRVSAAGNGKTIPSSRFAPRPVTVGELRQMIPLRNLEEEELAAFALTQEVETYGPGSTLFEGAQEQESVLFLLAGSVTIKINDEQNYQVKAGTAKARFPLAHGEGHQLTALTDSDVEVLRVPIAIMHKNFRNRLEEGNWLSPDQWDVPDRIRRLPLYQTFCQYVANEKLRLPTLPEIAVRLRRAIEKENVGVAEATKIVELDATIATKLIHIANSPLYNPASPIRNCLEAINRLGLKATCNLVVTLCLKDFFKAKGTLFNKKMHELWSESLQVAALSFVLAKDNRWPNPDEALLMGLICDIGTIPFLVFASEFPKEHYQVEEIDEVMAAIRGPASCFVLNKWDFPEDLKMIPLLAEMWHYDSGPDLELSDIVMLSKLHRYFEKGKIGEVPAISSIPACGKLRDGSLSPEYSLKVLHDAKHQVKEMLAPLR